MTRSLYGLILATACLACQATPSDDPAGARIVSDDLDRFWQAWDAAEGRPHEERVEAFQRLYLDPGTPGLRDWTELRIGSAERLVETIDAHRAYYSQLRSKTPRAAAAAEPAREAFAALERLYPPAVFPDVYLLVGILSSGGTTGPAGLLIGVDMYGLGPDTPTHELGEWHREVLRGVDSLPAIIAHELVHYQQPSLPRGATLLDKAFREGSADFVAERIAGTHVNDHVHAWALPREEEVWARFAKHMDGEETAGFLYAGDDRPDGWPADVGYFVGYRIAEAYHASASDPAAALATILRTRRAAPLLAASGYGDRFR